MIKLIQSEEELEVGKEYLELLKNDLPDTDFVSSAAWRFIVTEKPHYYRGRCEELVGTRWITVRAISSKGEIDLTEDETSLRDAGVTDTPHNNHKLYFVPGKELRKVLRMTIEEFEQYYRNQQNRPSRPVSETFHGLNGLVTYVHALERYCDYLEKE